MNTYVQLCRMDSLACACMCMYNNIVLYRTAHVDDYVEETTALPDHLVKGAGGVIGYEESAVRVSSMRGVGGGELRERMYTVLLIAN